jgi:hypothetical protein
VDAAETHQRAITTQYADTAANLPSRLAQMTWPQIKSVATAGLRGQPLRRRGDDRDGRLRLVDHVLDEVPEKWLARHHRSQLARSPACTDLDRAMLAMTPRISQPMTSFVIPAASVS